MTKYIVLFRPKDFEDLQAFTRRIKSELADRATDTRIVDLWMTHTTETRPLSLLPLAKAAIVCVSMRVHEGAPGLLDELELRSIDGFVGAYEADEALPVTYSRNWADGETTPGVCLLTLFHRKPAIDHATFIKRWHEGHTALSLRYHPLWHYNRNVVRQIHLTGGANPGANLIANAAPDAPYDGIVEEHFRERRDLLNPFRFYGRPHVIILRMITILIDILGFIDLGRIETYLVRETIMKSAP